MYNITLLHVFSLTSETYTRDKYGSLIQNQILIMMFSLQFD